MKSTPNSLRQSIQIVASVRTGDKVRQKIVRHVGIAMDDDELVRLKALAELVKAKLEAEHQASLFAPETVAKQVIEAKAKRASASIVQGCSEARDDTLAKIDARRQSPRPKLRELDIRYAQLRPKRRSD